MCQALTLPLQKGPVFHLDQEVEAVGGRLPAPGGTRQPLGQAHLR